VVGIEPTYDRLRESAARVPGYRSICRAIS